MQSPCQLGFSEDRHPETGYVCGCHLGLRSIAAEVLLRGHQAASARSIAAMEPRYPYPVFHVISHITPVWAYELPHRREIVPGAVF